MTLHTSHTLTMPFSESQTLVKTIFQSGLHRLRHSLMSIGDRTITTMVEEDRKWTSKLNFRIVLTYVYLVVMTGRYLLVSASLNTDLLPENYLLYDPLHDFVHQLGLLDRYLALVLWQLPLMFFYIDYLVSFVRRRQAYLHTYDLMVLNRQHFHSLNPQLSRSWRSLFGLLRKEKLIEVAEKVRLRWRQLPHLGPLDHPIRVRAVALAAAFDLLLAGAVALLTATCPLAVFFFSLTPVWASFGPLLRKLVVSVDGCLALYTSWHCVRISFTMVHFINLLLWVQCAQQRAANRRLQALLKSRTSSVQKCTTLQENEQNKENSVSGQQRQTELRLAVFIRSTTTFLRRHHQLVDDMLTFDREVFSRCLFLGLLTIFGFSVYSVTILCLKSDLSAFERTFTLVLFLIVSGVVAVGLRPVLAVHRTMHSPAPLLYQSVACLGLENAHGSYGSLSSCSNLCLKLKLSTYYEVLTSGQKFALSIGPVGQVTSNAIFEFVFVYVAYLLFSFNLILGH